MATNTTTYSFLKPTVGGDTNVWGGYLNSNFDDIDDLLDGTTPITGIDINSGTIDNAPIGGSTPAAGAFTTLSASSTLSVTGNTTVGGTLGVTGAATFTAAAVFNGAVTLGNATSDDITVTGYIVGDLIPKTDSNDDLGLTGQRWSNLWVDEATITGNVNLDQVFIGAGQATGGGAVARIRYSGDDFIIDPTDGAGGYDTTSQLYFDYSRGIWVIEGGLEVAQEAVLDPPTLWVREEVNAGVNGGAASTSGYNARSINTVEHNSITGASLASDTITLPAGTYHLVGSVQFFETLETKIKLSNSANTTDYIIAASGRVAAGSTNVADWLPIFGRFTLGSSTNLKLFYNASGTGGVQGVGYPASKSEREVYLDLMFVKVD